MANNPTPVDVSTLGFDAYELNRELDIVKAKVFLGKHAAFLGSLLSTVEMVWSLEFPTAATNSLVIWWNPHFFKSATPNLRNAVLIHELWHIARLHVLRQDFRDSDTWNTACDIVINNGMVTEGFVFENSSPLIDLSLSHLSEEEIYDDIHDGTIKPPPCPWGHGDMQPLSSKEQQQVLNNVVSAVHQSTLAGEAGKLPGKVTEAISKFLSPVIAWQQLLYRFFQDMQDSRYTWARPNRRFTDIYLPSRVKDEGRLAHLMYFLDVSGSIETADILRFNSEVAFIKSEFNPVKLTLVQFDTVIQKVDVFLEGDSFTSLEVIGRGGTCLHCVSALIEEQEPTAAIIFSDLCCEKMPPLKTPTPIIWVVLNNPTAEVNFGKMIHIKN